jgi:hypothetical protein
MDRITFREEIMKTRRRVFFVLATATTLGLTVAMPRLSQVVAQQSIVQGQAGGGRFESSPQTAGPGTTIFNRSIDPCPAAPTGGTTTVVVSLYDPRSGASGGIIASTAETPVGTGGTWSAPITVPANATEGRVQVLASCFYKTSGASVNYFDYSPNFVDVGANGPFQTGSGRFSITPSAGPPGTTFQAQSLDRCPPVGSSTNPRAIVTFFGQNGTTSSNVARIDGSGQWGPVAVVVPPGAAGGPATVYATCTDDSYSGGYSNTYNPCYNSSDPNCFYYYNTNPQCYVNGTYTGGQGCPPPGNGTQPPPNCYYNGSSYSGPGCGNGGPYSGPPGASPTYNGYGVGAGYFTYSPITFNVLGGPGYPGGPGGPGYPGIPGYPGGPAYPGGPFTTRSAGSASPSSVAPGQQVTISGSGGAPNSEATVTFNSRPVTLGTLRYDNTGRFTATVDVPTNADSGSHAIIVSGPGPQIGEVHEVTIPLTVVRSGRVPFTGAGVRRMVILATGLVLAGLLLLSGREIVGRQRAVTATSRWMSATRALRRD